MKQNFNKPVALVTEKRIVKFYPKLSNTARDGYDPEAVYRVCSGEQKSHKGKRFRFARKDEFEFIAQLHWCETFSKKAM